MAGVDKEFDGEVQHLAGQRIGYLPQEPELDPAKTVAGRSRIRARRNHGGARQKLEAVYAAYAEPDADFDKLAEEQARYENILATAGADIETQMEIAADALRPRAVGRGHRPVVRRRSAGWRFASCCCRGQTCSCWTSPPTTWTLNRWTGWNSS